MHGLIFESDSAAAHSAEEITGLKDRRSSETERGEGKLELLELESFPDLMPVDGVRRGPLAEL